MIQTLVPLDREFVPFYWLTVLAVDRSSVPLSSVTEVYIEVTDVNDNPPRMSRPVFYPSIQEDAPLGTSVLQLDAWDPDSSSQGKLTFNITSGNHMGFFVIHPSTGENQMAGWTGVSMMLLLKVWSLSISASPSILLEIQILRPHPR
jgi:protocadherin Fat 1/2/3